MSNAVLKSVRDPLSDRLRRTDTTLNNAVVTLKDFQYSTFGNFKSIEADELPNRLPDYTSPDSGSEYWYEGEYIFRRSDHWSPNMGSCSWLLDGRSFAGCEVQGKIRLKDFQRRFLFSGDFTRRYMYKIGIYSPGKLEYQTVVFQKLISKNINGRLEVLYQFDKLTIRPKHIIIARPHGKKSINFHRKINQRRK